jgi:hypothetical protein
MKKLILLVIVIPLMLIGCSNGSNLVTFDNTELAKELKSEGINPKLPTMFPVEIVKYERVIPPHESKRYETSFTAEGGEVFNVIIHSGQVTYNNQVKKEEVKINGNEGFYRENDADRQSLHWTDGEYHYILEYVTTDLDIQVTKKTMIETAESFE